MRRVGEIIELNRTFLEIPEVTGEADPEELVNVSIALGKARTWGEILESQYVVVLGEAGTGKTTEFKLRAATLTSSGAAGFFVELTTLASEGLRASLLPDEEDRLDDWQSSEEETVFFLDSLDEAKLNRRILREALRRLKRELRDQWNRVRLVISCRVSDWRDTDREVVETFVLDDLRNEIQVVQIAPLNTNQVAELAANFGVSDVERFTRAIEEGYAQAFVERPLDVGWLGAYWTKHGRLGSLRELIAENIDEKLTERSPQRVSTLPLEKAREGARALAGIATLTRRLSVSLPGDPVDVRRSRSAIDTNEVFVDWSRPEIEELLRTGLFDESTYRRVRFHHRSVQDFLTALWLQELREAGLPLSKVRDLFLREEGGEKAVPQHIGPVLAWLCLSDEALRMEIIKEAPDLLIAYGDPSGFTEDDRIAILRAYADTYTGRSRRFRNFEVASLERFATPALADPLATLLEQRDLPDELAAILFELVELGQVEACLPHAVKTALDVEQVGRARFAAIRAVASIGDDENHRSLLGLLDVTEVWSHDLAGAFVQALYPDILDVDGLILLLSRAEPKRKNHITLLQHVLEYDVPKYGSSTLKIQLLDSLLNLVWIEDEEGKPSIASGCDWMLQALGYIVGVIIDELPNGAEQPAAVIKTLELFRWCNEQGLRSWHGVDEVRKAISRHPEVRRMLFWQNVEEHRTEKGRVPTTYSEIRYRHDLYELSSDDIGWLSKDAQSRENIRERLLAFDALTWIPRSAEENEHHLDILRRVASKDPALIKRLERLLRRQSLGHLEEKKWARRQRARELRAERSESENRGALEKDVDSIRNGSNLNALYFLLRKAQDGGMGSSWGSASTELLQELYGDEIALAAEQGWCAFWRSHDPSLPHERERNRTPWEAVVGLVGINVEFMGGLDASKLDPALVTKASRYAANELNRFPDWLETLASLHPESVRTALEPTIVADYREEEVVHDVLSKLPRAARSIKDACVPVLLGLISESDPPTVIALTEAIATLLSTDDIDISALDSVVGDRCRASLDDRSRFGVWWLAWVSRNSKEALDFLEEIQHSQPQEKSYVLVEEICHRIHEGLGEAPIPLRRDVEALARLVPIVYDFIEIEDDIDHEDTYSPGPRDNAQTVRIWLVKWIAEIPGDDSVAALRRIADDPRVASVRDWILHHVDIRIVENAGLRASEAEESLLALYREHGIQARSHIADLGEGTQNLKILFLASNPTCTTPLELGEEIRQIEKNIRASELRDSITLRSCWGVQPGDLQQLLLEEEPTIVHFSGHGIKADGLVFHGEVTGDEQMVPGEALHSLFHALKDNIRVVVLNACDSEVQVETIVETIDIVIGMSDSIGDQAAISFAGAFYSAIGFGKSVQTAFDSAVALLETIGHEGDTPVLHSRDGVDASTVVLLPLETEI